MKQLKQKMHQWWETREALVENTDLPAVLLGPGGDYKTCLMAEDEQWVEASWAGRMPGEKTVAEVLKDVLTRAIERPALIPAHVCGLLRKVMLQAQPQHQKAEAKMVPWQSEDAPSALRGGVTLEANALAPESVGVTGKSYIKSTEHQEELYAIEDYSGAQGRLWKQASALGNRVYSRSRSASATKSTRRSTRRQDKASPARTRHLFECNG